METQNTWIEGRDAEGLRLIPNRGCTSYANPSCLAETVFDLRHMNDDFLLIRFT